MKDNTKMTLVMIIIGFVFISIIITFPFIMRLLSIAWDYGMCGDWISSGKAVICE